MPAPRLSMLLCSLPVPPRRYADLPLQELHNLLAHEHAAQRDVGVPLTISPTWAIREIVGASGLVHDPVERALLLVSACSAAGKCLERGRIGVFELCRLPRRMLGNRLALGLCWYR